MCIAADCLLVGVPVPAVYYRLSSSPLLGLFVPSLFILGVSVLNHCHVCACVLKPPYWLVCQGMPSK